MFFLPAFHCQLSKITCANACTSVCVILNAILFTPNSSAIFFASPSRRIVGRPPNSRTTSKSTHRTPRLHPVPNAFIAASFAANRPAKRSYLFLNCSQYSLSAPVYTRRRNAAPCRSIAARIRPTSAKSTPMPIIKVSPCWGTIRSARSAGNRAQYTRTS
jgi:hypothetical protein